jgi:two-component system sensor histidine kinase DctS
MRRAADRLDERFLDISEQRRVEELSRASQERLQATARLATVGEMASLLSHELNQPLAAIASYATGSINLLQGGDRQAIAPDLAAGHAAHCRAGRARRAGDQERARLRAPPRPGARSRCAQRADRRGHAAGQLAGAQAVGAGPSALEPGLPRSLCDRTMVEQVLLNLARNAMQAMDSAGDRRASQAGAPGPKRVRSAAHLTPLQGWVEFSVADRGPGIPPRWPASCSRRSSPPRPRAWAWA